MARRQTDDANAHDANNGTLLCASDVIVAENELLASVIWPDSQARTSWSSACSPEAIYPDRLASAVNSTSKESCKQAGTE